MMLGLGALFLSMTTEYAPAIYSLLFGEVLGVSTNELLPTGGNRLSSASPPWRFSTGPFCCLRSCPTRLKRTE